MYKYSVFEIKTNENNAAKKNEFIKAAREKGDDYIFIHQDDIEILPNITIFEQYCKLMEDYKTSLVFYGFYKQDNRLFNGFPNPSINIKISDTESLQIHRRISRALIGICLKNNETLFNENLKVYELEEYIRTIELEGKLPLGNGFFLDVPMSWESIHVKEGNFPVAYTAEMIEADKKYFTDNKINFSVESNVDALMVKILELRKDIKA